MNEVTRARLDVLADELHVETDAYIRLARQALPHALNAGEKLIEAKALCRHGEWGPWLQTNFPLTERTARTWMELAPHRERLESLGSIREAMAVLQDSRKSEVAADLPEAVPAPPRPPQEEHAPPSIDPRIAARIQNGTARIEARAALGLPDHGRLRAIDDRFGTDAEGLLQELMDYYGYDLPAENNAEGHREMLADLVGEFGVGQATRWLREREQMLEWEQKLVDLLRNAIERADR